MEALVGRLAELRGNRVFSLVSGGVDSSVATALALAAGLEVTGVIMLNHPRANDEAAANLCRALGIELATFDLRADFERSVLEPFRASYAAGRTPNPCAVCNRAIKFGLLWERIAERYGTDDFLVLTGHYARIERDSTGVRLCRGVDERKDQSYFLCMLPYERVRRLVLPLGEVTKRDVRGMSEALGARGAKWELFAGLAEKPESMDICFMEEGDYRPFLPRSAAGEVVDQEGRSLGRHSGVHNFTLGQRKGLGISSPEPLFVVDIRPDENLVVVAGREAATTHLVTAEAINVLLPECYCHGARLTAKVRSQSPPSPCTISLGEAGRLTARFAEPQFAPAPGQYLALYSDDALVAGGEIVRD